MRTLIAGSITIIGTFVGAVLGALSGAPPGSGSMTGLVVGLVGGTALAWRTYPRQPRQPQYHPDGPGPRRPRESYRG